MELIHDEKIEINPNYPKVCFVCGKPHIQSISVDRTDGIRSWHKDCGPKEIIPVPTDIDKIVVTDESVKDSIGLEEAKEEFEQQKKEQEEKKPSLFQRFENIFTKKESD